MVSKLKEKRTQYTIAVSIIVIMFAIKAIGYGFLNIEEVSLYNSFVNIISDFSFNFILVLMFRDVSYSIKYEEIINSKKFIFVKNIIFIMTMIVCMVYLILDEIKNPEPMSLGIGIVVAGSTIQVLNLEIRNDTKLWKKILGCTFCVLFALVLLAGSVSELL